MRATAISVGSTSTTPGCGSWSTSGSSRARCGSLGGPPDLDPGVLVAKQPEAFLPHLAISLHNLGNCLSEVGQRAAAITASVAGLLAALFERAAQDRKHGPILVAARFDLGANQRLQPEDADRESAERSHGAVSDQVLIAVSKTNTPEYVEWSTACEQQMVSFAFEGSRFGA